MYGFWLKVYPPFFWRVYPPFLWRTGLGKSSCCEEKCKPIIVCDADVALHFLAYFVLRKTRLFRFAENVALTVIDSLFTYLRTLYINISKGYTPKGSIDFLARRGLGQKEKLDPETWQE